MPAPIVCPICKLKNPHNALRCDCGYALSSEVWKYPILVGAPAMKQTPLEALGSKGSTKLVEWCKSANISEVKLSSLSLLSLMLLVAARDYIVLRNLARAEECINQAGLRRRMRKDLLAHARLSSVLLDELDTLRGK